MLSQKFFVVNINNDFILSYFNYYFLFNFFSFLFKKIYIYTNYKNILLSKNLCCISKYNLVKTNTKKGLIKDCEITSYHHTTPSLFIKEGNKKGNTHVHKTSTSKQFKRNQAWPPLINFHLK